MAKTVIDINEEALALAAEALGTKTKKDTVNAALEEIGARVRRERAIEKLIKLDEEGAFDKGREPGFKEEVRKTWGDIRGAGFLIDTSAAHRIMRPEPLAMWRSALSAGRIGMCAATEAEALYSAKSAAHYHEMRTAFGELYTWCAIPDDAWSAILDLQETLAEAGCGRSAGVVDLLVAHTAMSNRLTVLHYDRDFETIGEHIGLNTQWLAEPGSIH